MKEVHVESSEWRHDGLTVHLDNGWYYMHGIQEIGTTNDAPGSHNSMWGWINHMREKNWWNGELENEFVSEVKKQIYG